MSAAEETQVPRSQLFAEEFTRIITRALYFALIAARVGVVEYAGTTYALTWDAGE